MGHGHEHHEHDGHTHEHHDHVHHERYADRTHPEYVRARDRRRVGHHRLHRSGHARTGDRDLADGRGRGSGAQGRARAVDRRPVGILAVFDQIPDGSYTLWIDDVARARDVRVTGGLVKRLAHGGRGGGGQLAVNGAAGTASGSSPRTSLKLGEVLVAGRSPRGRSSPG